MFLREEKKAKSKKLSQSINEQLKGDLYRREWPESTNWGPKPGPKNTN